MNTIITKQHGRIFCNRSSDVLGEVLTYALSSYGYLLPFNGEFTLEDLAERVKSVYSLDNPQNNAVYNALVTYQDKGE